MPGPSRKHGPKVTFRDERRIYLLACDPDQMRTYRVGSWSVRQLILALDRVLSNSVEITTAFSPHGHRTYERRLCQMADQYAMLCGRLPKVTWTVMVCEPLRIFKVTCSPTLSFEIRACSWLMSETGLPSTATMTSPPVTSRPGPVMATRFSPLMPAFRAGLPGAT